MSFDGVNKLPRHLFPHNSHKLGYHEVLNYFLFGQKEKKKGRKEEYGEKLLLVIPWPFCKLPISFHLVSARLLLH